jgi:microcompartment protein CcmK/EutM
MLVLVEPCSTRAPCSETEGSVAAGSCGAGVGACTGATEGSAVAACCTVGLAVVAAVVCSQL